VAVNFIGGGNRSIQEKTTDLLQVTDYGIMKIISSLVFIIFILKNVTFYYHMLFKKMKSVGMVTPQVSTGNLFIE
jgi:hypothetical protein